jgi:HPt (histidine-containing phosphotransfer) domain-containing protein
MIQVLGRWIGTPSGAAKGPAPPPKPAPPPASSVPINIPEALERVGGNGKLLVEVLELFRGHHAFDAQKFEVALSTGDGKAAHRLIHTLKGAAGNLAMHGLWASALKLQRALEEGGKVSDQQRKEFRTAFDAVLDALDPAIAEARAAAPSRAAGMH